MSARVTGCWALVLALVLAVGLSACGRHSSTSKKAQTPSSAQGTLHRTKNAGAGAMAATGGGANNGQESDGPMDDRPQDQSDRSLEHLAALPPEAQLPTTRWKLGVNYMPLVPSQMTHVEPGKVEVMEVFWMGCIHCYALEPALQKWLQTKPSYVQFVRVPVMWGPVHRAHARLYYTLLALKHEDLVQKAFDTIQHGEVLVSNSEEETLAAQKAFARANGINPDEFARAYDSAEVNQNLQRAAELTVGYHVDSVPLLAIDGKYTTSVDMAGGAANLFSLINDLANAEHNRGSRT